MDFATITLMIQSQNTGFPPISFERFQSFHDEFQGDTWDILHPLRRQVRNQQNRQPDAR